VAVALLSELLANADTYHTAGLERGTATLTSTRPGTTSWEDRSKGNGTMKYVTCNLCGEDDYKVVYGAGVAQINRVVACKSCGLMYANPRAQEEAHVLLRDSDPDFVFDELTKRNRQRLEKEALQVRDYEVTRAYLATIFPNRGRLLEVGSGLGYLLQYFRKDGWDTLGVEPNAGYCRYAISELGLQVIPKILPEAGVAHESMDVVLMMHVIEHVSNPVETLRDVHLVLKPGGLFVMETPRYDTMMFKLMRKRERSLSCDGHIYFFTSESLRRLSQRAGFDVLREDIVGRSLTMDRLFYNVGVMTKSKQLQSVLSALSKKAHLNQLRMSLNMHDMERIYLRKPGTYPPQVS
jgi:SAM-dependent methyltransferase